MTALELVKEFKLYTFKYIDFYLYIEDEKEDFVLANMTFKNHEFKFEVGDILVTLERNVSGDYSSRVPYSFEIANDVRLEDWTACEVSVVGLNSSGNIALSCFYEKCKPLSIIFLHDTAFGPESILLTMDNVRKAVKAQTESISYLIDFFTDILELKLNFVSTTVSKILNQYGYKEVGNSLFSVNEDKDCSDVVITFYRDGMSPSIFIQINLITGRMWGNFYNKEEDKDLDELEEVDLIEAVISYLENFRK